MPRQNTNLLLRNDTVLGVCEGIGSDFGFHPNWLRLTFAGFFYFFPAIVIGTYLGLGAVVALTRWFAPDGVEVSAPRLAAVQADQSSTVEEERVVLAA